VKSFLYDHQLSADQRAPLFLFYCDSLEIKGAVFIVWAHKLPIWH